MLGMILAPVGVLLAGALFGWYGFSWFRQMKFSRTKKGVEMKITSSRLVSAVVAVIAVAGGLTFGLSLIFCSGSRPDFSLLCVTHLVCDVVLAGLLSYIMMFLLSTWHWKREANLKTPEELMAEVLVLDEVDGQYVKRRMADYVAEQNRCLACSEKLRHKIQNGAKRPPRKGDRNLDWNRRQTELSRELEDAQSTIKRDQERILKYYSIFYAQIA